MPIRKTKLGKPLPPVEDIPVPTQAELDLWSAQWDALVPEYAGLLDAKPIGWTGTPAPRYWYDEVKRETIRASDGRVVKMKEKQAAYEKFIDRLRK